jgi:hypothetical protein
MPLFLILDELISFSSLCDAGKCAAERRPLGTDRPTLGRIQNLNRR